MSRLIRVKTVLAISAMKSIAKQFYFLERLIRQDVIHLMGLTRMASQMNIEEVI